jgi:hypothetical protein
MRWYQHNLHGAYPTCSLKYRLPTMAPVVIAHMIHNPEARTWASHDIAHAAFPSNRIATPVRRPPIKVPTPSKALKSCTESEFTPPFLRPFWRVGGRIDG